MNAIRAVLASALVLGAATRAAAQGTADTLAWRDSVHVAAEVDQRVRVDPALAAMPEFPSELRSAGVSGEVLAEFVVDTLGAAEMDTFRADSSTDPLFTEAVRNAVAASRYVPAMLRGHAVRQLVQQPFLFRSDTTQTAQASSVDRVAELLPDSPTATYPPALRSAGVEAIVVARFVVDSTGLVDTSTFRLTEVRVFRRVDMGEVTLSDGAQRIAFGDAVRAVASSLRFAPATVDGRAVRQLVRMPFTFVIPM